MRLQNPAADLNIVPEIVTDPKKWWVDDTASVSEYDKSAVDMSGDNCCMPNR